MDKMLNCSNHGKSEAYICCTHCMAGAPHEIFDEHTETEPGFAACKNCDNMLAAMGNDNSDKLTQFMAENFKAICRRCAVHNKVIPPKEGDPIPEILIPIMVSGEERHKEHPATFEIPPLGVRNDCIKGTLVKLLWEDEAGSGNGERMWVEVQTPLRDGKYTGLLKNQPYVFREHLKLNQELTFGPENIICVG